MLGVVAAGCSESARSSQWSTRDQSIVPTTTDPVGLSTGSGTAKQISFDDQGMSASAVQVLMQANISDDPLMRANSARSLCRLSP